MAPNFGLGKTYIVRCMDNAKCYVGSTVMTLAQRMAKHRCSARQNKEYPLYVAMREIGISRFYIELIEDVPCERHEQLAKAEGIKIRELNTQIPNGYNVRIAGRDCKQYYVENREAILVNKKQYAEANREAIATINKAHYVANRDMVIEKVKTYYDANIEAIAAYKKQYAEANREAISAKRKARYAANREAERAQQKTYNDLKKAERLSATI